MSVTAFPVLARNLADSGLGRTRVGGIAPASAAIGDFAALVPARFRRHRLRG